MLEPANIATIIVAVVGLAGMWGSQKISARASTQNQKGLAEVEAYARAVKMDRETIARQDEEIADLALDKKNLREENFRLKQELHKKEIANTALVKQVLSLQERIREDKNEK